MIKGIIFDMDGVVIDSNSIHYENWNNLFEKKFNVTISKREFAEHLGESAKDFMEYFIKRYKISQSYEELLPEILNNYVKLENEVKLKKGIADALARFSKKYKIALATGANKDWAIENITKLGISDYFDFVIAGNEVKQAKPSPEIFLKAAEVLKLKPAECVVIEDASLGITAAKKAGMFAVSIPDELTKFQDHATADLHLKSISELTEDLLNKLGGKNGQGK